MNVTLTPELEQIVAERLRSGLYQSVNEVIRDGLLLLGAEDERARKHEELKREIQKGIDSLDRGEGKPLNEEEIERICAEGQARRATRPNGHG